MKLSITFRRFVQAWKGLPIIHSVTVTSLTLLGFLIIILHHRDAVSSIPYYKALWNCVPLFLGTLLIVILRLMDFRGTFLPFIVLLYLTSLGMIYRFSFDYRDLMESPAKLVSLQIVTANVRETAGDVVIGLIGLGVIFSIILVLGGGRITILRRRYYLLFVASIGLLFLSIIWMKIVGTRFLFSRTPWELLKVVIVIALAGFFAENLGRFKRRSLFSQGALIVFWVPLGVMWIIPQFLFVLMGDAGQLMIYGLFVLLFIYAATSRLIFLVIGVALLAGCFDLLTVSMSHFPAYIQDRFLVWTDLYHGFPSDEWWNRSCQAFQAFFAMKAGGFFGTGPGGGHPGLIPLADSDFAYAGMSELFGLCGVLILFSLYLTLIFAGSNIAEKSPNLFGRYLAIGLVLLFSSQIIVNIAGILNLIPLTGITLPFVSKGGFSYITNAVIIGILMALSDKKRRNLGEDKSSLSKRGG